MKHNSLSLIVGASSGIGRSLALALARERRHIGLIDYRDERLPRVAREVEMFGGEAFIAVSDVRDPASIQATLAQVALSGERLETVFLSAGIAEATDTEQFRAEPLVDTFRTNVFGVTHWLEALQPFLRAQPEGGTVVVLSSISARRAIPGGSANYSASKAAVSQLCDGLRAPLAKQGIRLVTVEPGFVRTPMTDHNVWMPFAVDSEDAAAAILDGIRRGQAIIRFPRPVALAMEFARLLPAKWLDRLYVGKRL